MRRLASTGLVLCLVGCATPRSEQLSSITVIQRPTYAICAGYCPNLSVGVREDGRVTLSTRGDQQVTSVQAAQFARILEPYRPVVPEAGPASCASWNTADPLVPKVYRYEIMWIDADGKSTRLRSCGGLGLGETIRQVFWSIGLYLGGEPRP